MEYKAICVIKLQGTSIPTLEVIKAKMTLDELVSSNEQNSRLKLLALARPEGG